MRVDGHPARDAFPQFRGDGKRIRTKKDRTKKDGQKRTEDKKGRRTKKDGGQKRTEDKKGRGQKRTGLLSNLLAGCFGCARDLGHEQEGALVGGVADDGWQAGSLSCDLAGGGAALCF